MIKVNLAKSYVPASGADPVVGGGDVIYSQAEIQKQGVMRLALLLIFPVALYVYEQFSLPELASRRNAASAKLEELRQYNTQMEKSVEEIKRFKEDEAKIQARIASLERLDKIRFREIKVLELIQQVIPEKVWMTKVDFNNGRMLLSGMAMTDYEISGFMEALAKSVFFLDVNLVSSSEIILDGLTIKRFEISCVMERPTT